MTKEQKYNACPYCTSGDMSSSEIKYKEALEKIRDIDFRGNRSTESQIAHKVLEDD